MFKQFKSTGLVLIFMATLSACSNDYAPTASATGKQIYASACVRCHSDKPDNVNKYWVLNKQDANKAYVMDKIASGSMRMPGFTNFKAEDLEKISEFVLQHSIIK